MIGSVSSFPKSLKQIQKLKERSQRKSDHLVATQTTKKDELFAIMLKCVEDKTGTKGHSRLLSWQMSDNLRKQSVSVQIRRIPQF